MAQDPMFQYWGKARPREQGASYHLLPYHSLDVAAAGSVYLLRHPTLCDDLALGFGVSPEVLQGWLIFFLAIHDLGKFSEGFQNLRGDLFEHLHHRTCDKPYPIRHDSLGFLLWTRHLRALILNEDWFGFSQEPRSMRRLGSGLDFWAMAMTGHHGQPPERRPNNHEPLLEDHFSATDLAAAEAFAREARRLFLGDLPPLDRLDPKVFKKQSVLLSWWLAGVAVLADWLGSGNPPFVYQAQPEALDAYWRKAVKRAEDAVERAGVIPASVAAPHRFSALFPFISKPSDLQAKAATLPLDGSQQLILMEEITGGGKTEAALYLSHRLLSEQRHMGLYVALPTMATANAMFERVGDVYRSLYTPEARPSLVLAHSARRMVAEMARQQFAVESEQESYSSGEQTAGAHCSAWLAEGAKRALLADVGVGTIDQALLAVLYARHQSLRLLGLYRKVLIVDEVHACDAYVLVLLRKLLRFHAAVGGSAILLSATLPRQMREALIDSFCEGANIPSPGELGDHYPLLTKVSASRCQEIELAPRPEVVRTVSIEWCKDEASVHKIIDEALATGRCICWIRNTVNDALAAYRMLRERVGEERLTLFHARFAMVDRFAIENRVLAWFGKESTAEQRRGRVLIATQVVEQSLDLDFDMMISDLAPVDLLIQRAGRLCRHRRDSSGNPLPTDQADERGPPKLFVHGPWPADAPDENWFKASFPGAAAVYPDHGRLWLTARELITRGQMRMPDDARVLIETVYGEEAEDRVPEGLMGQVLNALGDDLGKRSQGRANTIEEEAGYAIEGANWWSEAKTPTRLGEESIVLRLARWNGETLEPWSDVEPAWDLSQVRVRRALVAAADVAGDAALGVALEEVAETLPDKGKWSIVLPLTKDPIHEWRGLASNDSGKKVTIRYNGEEGLAIELKEN